MFVFFFHPFIFIRHKQQHFLFNMSMNTQYHNLATNWLILFFFFWLFCMFLDFLHLKMFCCFHTYCVRNALLYGSCNIWLGHFLRVCKFVNCGKASGVTWSSTLKFISFVINEWMEKESSNEHTGSKWKL